MIKEIKYGGFTANPDDHGSIEGDLAVAMNLIPEDGTVKPVLPPADVFQIPGGGTIMCLHKTSSYTHYIMHQSGNNALYLLHDDGGMPYDGGMIHQFGEGVEIHKVEPVGNALVVLASDSVHYILWRNGSYHYLGNHLPELDLQFWLSKGGVVFSDTHSVDLKVDGATPSVNTITNNKDLSHSLRQAIMASANQAVEKAAKKKQFTFPFFVRYALHMYDGSVMMHSAPMLMVQTMDVVPKVWKGFILDSNGYVEAPYTTNTVAQVDAWDMMYRVIDSSQLTALDAWRDIVTDVDIYISPQFYTYNQAAEDDNIDMFNEPHLERKDIAKDVCANGSFFFAASISLKRMAVVPAGMVSIDFEPTNDNIVTRDRMTDDYGTHDGLQAGKSYVYNSRINLAQVTRRLFGGFNPLCLWWRFANLDDVVISRYTRHLVVIEEDGREIVIESSAEPVPYVNGNILWYFYPNQNAKRVYVQMDNDIVELELAPHPTLNGAYYCSLDEDAVQQSADSVPTPSTDEQRLVVLPNRVYTSEVNNPFYFPAVGINTVGNGEIIGICAAVKAMSQGQFGQFPLYAFTTEGVWALQPGENGGYLSVHPVSRDVCLPSASITQLDDSVLFTSARGIMLISGSQVQCISEALHDKGMLVGSMNDNINLLAGLNGIGNISIDRFNTFLQGCRMLYDYAGRRIIVYNPGYSYAYIYSLQSNKWGMTASSIRYTINSYPDALAVTSDNELVNYSGRVDYDAAPAASQLLLTRPLTLDQPDVLKTVDTVLQRGMFHKRAKHVQCVLYGSRDLYNWHLVASSKDENLRGFRGTPYQWFRIGLLLRLEPGESITGCTIQFEPRQTNRLR